jgi:hypothetical protein
LFVPVNLGRPESASCSARSRDTKRVASFAPRSWLANGSGPQAPCCTLRRMPRRLTMTGQGKTGQDTWRNRTKDSMTYVRRASRLGKRGRPQLRAERLSSAVTVNGVPSVARRRPPGTTTLHVQWLLSSRRQAQVRWSGVGSTLLVLLRVGGLGNLKIPYHDISASQFSKIYLTLHG